MDYNEAVKTVLATGKTAEAKAIINKHADRAAQKFHRIRNDAKMSEEARRWELAVEATRARNDLDADMIELAGRQVRTDRSDASRVFGVEGLPGDAASLVISRRDAADRVAAITDRKELRELLARATRSGDEVLARAVAERAVENDDAATLNAFIADRPHLEAAAERLWNVQQAETGTFELTMELMAFRPPEFSGMSRDQIESIAMQEPTTVAR